MIEIKELQANDETKYSKFLKNTEDSLFEHSLAVKDLIQKHFHFTPKYLIAIDKEEDINQKIHGILPLFEAKSIIEGKRLVSLPFFPFGGVIAKNKEIKKQLIDTAIKLAENYPYIEIRQRGGFGEELDKELKEKHKEHFERQIPITDFFIDFEDTLEATWSNLHPEIRKHIKRAVKNSLKFELRSDDEALEMYYDLYLNTRKKRGVPAWPKALFKEALKTTNSKIGLIFREGDPIVAGYFHFHKKEILYGFSGADYSKLHLRPYFFLVWKMIQYGFENGYTHIDYGGSSKQLNDGKLSEFKERWCNKKEEIPYYYYAKEKKNIPNLDSSLGLYRLYGKVWCKLPKPVINIISPPIIRQFS